MVVDDRPGRAVAAHVPRRCATARRRAHGPAARPAAGRPPPATPGWRAGARPGSPSSTTTSSSRPGWRGPWPPTSRGRRRTSPRSQGRIVVPLPARTAPHGLGAQRRRPGARALGDGRPGLPADRAGGGRRLRRALPPRLPRGRRPRRCGSTARRLADRARRAPDAAPGRARRPLGVASASQAGNADDALMRRAARPRTGASAPARRAGRWPRHAGDRRAPALAAARPRPPPGARARRLAAAAAWAAGTAELAWARIAPGPRSRDEVVTMLARAPRMPFAADGLARRRPRDRAPPRAPARRDAAPPAGRGAVRPRRDARRRRALQRRPGAGRADARARAEALDRLRAAGVPTARRLQPERHRPRPADPRAGRRRQRAGGGAARAARAAGAYCPHGPDDGCALPQARARPRARRGRRRLASIRRAAS